MALSSFFSLDGVNVPSKWQLFKYSKAVSLSQMFFKSPSLS